MFFFSRRRRHTRCALVTGVQTCALPICVIAMFASIAVLFFLPWLDSSPVKSSNYRPIYRWFFWILVLDVFVLGFCGMQPAEQPYVIASQIGAIYYFAHFLVILPIVSRIERPLPMPNSITEAEIGRAHV